MNKSNADKWISAKPTQSPRPRIRENKIRAIRQQLLKGKYDLNKRLDVTATRILQDLISPN